MVLHHRTSLNLWRRPGPRMMAPVSVPNDHPPAPEAQEPAFDPGALADAEGGAEATRAEKLSWILYDWANSGYGLVVIGPVFTPFFLRVLLPPLPEDPTVSGLVVGGITLRGSALMGLLASVSMLMMAIGAPVLGAVADIRGWTKRLLILFATTGAVLAMMMGLLRPGQWLLGATLYIASNFCFGTSFAFYNAYLPTLTRPSRQGSLSGQGYAAGYIGGAVALILVLVLITSRPDDPRMVALGLALSGAWWLVFSLPAFFILREIPPTPPQGETDAGPVLLAGARRVAATFRHLRAYRMLFLFLLAFLLFNDGVDTVISMSPAYASDPDVLNMSEQELIVLFLIVQFVAFGGALVSGYLADRIGNKTVVLGNLVVWVLVTFTALLITRPWQFMALGVVIGMVLGGIQSSSRALMGQLAPASIRSEAFGFFSIAGKFASIFGPLLWFLFTIAFGPRWAVLSVPPFMLAGLVVLLFVREPRGKLATDDIEHS